MKKFSFLLLTVCLVFIPVVAMASDWTVAVTGFFNQGFSWIKVIGNFLIIAKGWTSFGQYGMGGDIKGGINQVITYMAILAVFNLFPAAMSEIKSVFDTYNVIDWGVSQ